MLDMVHYSVSKILHIDDITKLDNMECYMNDDNREDDDDDDGDDLGETLLSALTKTEYTNIKNKLH